MIQPEILDIQSVHLAPPSLPEDPNDCEIAFTASVGPRDGDGNETFHFLVVTPAWLSRSSSPRWGRGTLILPSFEWQTLVRALAELLARAARPTWEQVVAELSKDLVWDFDRQGLPEA
jgi:hypothetical protein